MTKSPHPARKKPTPVDPETYFRLWAYVIHPYHYQALGVSLRDYVDREKTKAARARGAEQGLTHAQCLKIASTYRCYVVDNPPAYDFSEGALFTPRCAASPCLQVFDGPGYLEVHAITTNPARRRLFALGADDLAAWLETGTEPPLSMRLDRVATEHPALFKLIEPWPAI